MSFIYRFFVFFIPTKTKEKLINYLSAQLFNQQQKVWIDDVLKVLDQKCERLASQNIQQKAFIDAQIELISQKQESIEGKLVSKVVNIHETLEYFGNEIDIRNIQQKAFVDAQIELITQKQESIEGKLVSKIVEHQNILESYGSDIGKFTEQQINFKSECELLSQNILQQKVFIDSQIELIYQKQESNLIYQDKKLFDSIEKINDDSILTDEEYREWELQFESKENKEIYFERLLKKLNPGDKYLDIGCGGGELLLFGKQKGAIENGLDISIQAINNCKEKGLNVALGNALDLLGREKENTYDYITLIHIIEHLSPQDLRCILNRVYLILKPNGRILIETPNIQSLFTLSRYYYMDSTHKRPKHPSLIKYVLEKIGFKDIMLDFSGDIPAGFDLSTSKDGQGQILNEILFSGGGNIYLEGKK